jgi:hypothetical protein
VIRPETVVCPLFLCCFPLCFPYCFWPCFCLPVSATVSRPPFPS